MPYRDPHRTPTMTSGNFRVRAAKDAGMPHTAATFCAHLLVLAKDCRATEILTGGARRGG